LLGQDLTIRSSGRCQMNLRHQDITHVVGGNFGSNSDVVLQFESGLLRIKANHLFLKGETPQFESATFVTNSDWACQDCALVCLGRGRQDAGRVEKWRGSNQEVGLSVAGPFGRRCPSSRSIAPFPLPARRTERALLTHSALGQELMLAPTGGCGSASAGGPARVSRAGTVAGSVSSHCR
jgi:hypothetical protein